MFQAYLLQEMFAAELARRAGTKMQQQHRSMLQYKDVGELFIKPDLLSAGVKAAGDDHVQHPPAPQQYAAAGVCSILQG